MYKWKILRIHAFIWAIWIFVLCSWALFTRTPQPMPPLIYNLSSLIVVFYIMRWAASKYWRRIENQTHMWVNPEGLTIKYPGAKHYIFQKPVLGVLAIVLGYIVISWFVDGFFMQMGWLPKRYVNFYIYTYQRWSAESMVVCAGNVMAAIEYHFRKQKEKDKAMDEAYNELSAQHKRFNDHLKNTISDLESQAMAYKHAKDEWQRRIDRLPPGTGEY